LLDNTITSQSGSSFSLNPYDLNIFLESFDLNSETFSEEALDFCFTPNFSIPTPFFIIDDTVCINEIIEFYNLENTDADNVTWSAPGSSIENSQSYVLDNLTYLNPGKYEITQSINTDGCTSEFTREIVVVPPVEHNLTTDLILCDSVAYLIARTEGVIDYLWNNGATSENLLTEEKGIYSVLMSDLYCTQNVTFNIDYFNYDEIKVGLGNDTVICIQYPLSTNIILSDTTEFTWNDNYLNLNREFLETGYYELITSLNGCKSITGITVTVEDCSAQLYLPNVFSPNQDGINDSFFPLGDFFEVLDFRIYDRWGSEVHSGNTAWKGNTKNKQSSMGVYHYVLRIRNTLLDAEELITGDVTLIR
jgi:gliding motility-associated-like protein